MKIHLIILCLLLGLVAGAADIVLSTGWVSDGAGNIIISTTTTSTTTTTTTTPGPEVYYAVLDTGPSTPPSPIGVLGAYYEWVGKLNNGFKVYSNATATYYISHSAVNGHNMWLLGTYVCTNNPQSPLSEEYFQNAVGTIGDISPKSPSLYQPYIPSYQSVTWSGAVSVWTNSP